MTKVKAHFDGSVFVPEGPVDLQPGASVDVIIKKRGEGHAQEEVSLLEPVIHGLDRDTSLAVAHDPELSSDNL